MTLLLLLAAIAMFVALALMALSGEPGSSKTESQRRLHRAFAPGSDFEAAVLAARIFSPQDHQFVAELRDPELLRLYRRERSRVAIDWIRKTSGEISAIMQTHRLQSRQSANLDPAAEGRLFFEFVRLRVLCATLQLTVRALGPHTVIALAARTGELCQRLARSLPQANSAGIEGSAS